MFASDALSSVAYAPDEIFIMLSTAGAAAYVWSWKIGIAVALVMIAVVMSYRQTVHAYPSGGGDYEVATTNLGPTAGVTVASALLVDYVLTVAVSISSGAQYAASAIGFLSGHEAALAVVMVVFLTALNLRGVKESGTYFAIPTYLFMLAIIGMCAVGVSRYFMGNLPPAESASLTIDVADKYQGGLTGLALVILLARAFSSGSAALTGVEAISNGVPAFRKPKSKNAATTLAMLGGVAITMMISVIVLANAMNIRYVDPHHLSRLLLPNGSPVPADYDEHTVIAQIARGVFDVFPAGFYFVVIATGVILVLAANTAFNGFPVLGSILARDGFLPRQLALRGDRLAYSNGILILAVMAIALIVAFNAEVTRLIQLYIVGVFVSFNLSQLGMIRHWTRLLRTETDRGLRRKMIRSRLINAFGLSMTSVVFVIVLVTKFLAGAWIAILAMTIFFLMMRGIRKHYASVERELEVSEEDQSLPSRVHALVLVSKLDKPTIRALMYAKASRPNTLEALMISDDPEKTSRVRREWEQAGIDVVLKVKHSAYREVVRPITDYVRQIRKEHPRTIVAAYIPQSVVGRWWEQLLHNQTALRLKSRLLFIPGVMVIAVPYQLSSSAIGLERARRFEEATHAGDVRRGPGRKSDEFSWELD